MKDGYEFVDVISFDPEVMTAVVPEVLQAKALIFLFPMVTNRKVPSPIASADRSVFFMRQTIDNACGSIALIHALANCPEILEEDSELGQFITKTDAMGGEERGKALETNESICSIHGSFAMKGHTEAPEATADIDLHFVAFIAKNGQLYELDGQRTGPLCHGAISDQTEFFQSCCDAIKASMDLEGEGVSVSAMALVPTASYIQ